MLHAMGYGTNDDDAERERREGLLERDAVIHRDRHIVWPRMRRNRSPFLTPAQPRPTTVSTLWPGSSRERAAGRFSSRRTRIRQQRLAGEAERRNGLFAPCRRELAQKLVERIASFQIVEQ